MVDYFLAFRLKNSEKSAHVSLSQSEISKVTVKVESSVDNVRKQAESGDIMDSNKHG